MTKNQKTQNYHEPKVEEDHEEKERKLNVDSSQKK